MIATFCTNVAGMKGKYVDLSESFCAFTGGGKDSIMNYFFALNILCFIPYIVDGQMMLVVRC